MSSRRRSRSRGREGEFVLAEDHGEPVGRIGLLSEEDDRMRKKAYKTAKQGFASYKEDYNTNFNVAPIGEWDVDKKTNFLHIPFKISTFPSCGMFEKYFKMKFSDKRAVVEYDGDDRFILKLDWEHLLTQEESMYGFVRQYRNHALFALLVVMMVWYWFIWTSLRTVKEIKE
jgi:hypothetical protein